MTQLDILETSGNKTLDTSEKKNISVSCAFREMVEFVYPNRLLLGQVHEASAASPKSMRAEDPPLRSPAARSVECTSIPAEVANGHPYDDTRIQNDTQ